MDMGKRKLTYDVCKEIASMHNTYNDFVINGDKKVWYKIKRDGWEKLISHIKLERKPKGYWTKERVIEEAKRHNNFTDWNKSSSESVRASYSLGIHKECTEHMVKLQITPFKWTYKECEIISKLYKTHREFKKSEHNGCYQTIIKKGYNELLEHLVYDRKTKGYYTLDVCKDISLKYKTRSEVQKYDSSAYKVIWKNGWEDECYKHMIMGIRNTNSKPKYIYALEFSDNYAYIGLTQNNKKREGDHKRLTETVIKENPTVTRHILKTGLLPKYIILTNEPIERSLASEKELYYYNKYKDDGWKMLNIKKPGSLGGMNPIWIYEKFKELTDQCKTTQEFNKLVPSYARCIMRKNDWYDELTSHMIITKSCFRTKWTNDSCIKEMKKYKNKSDFKHNCPSAYNYARKHDILNYVFTSLRIYWTDKKCIEEGKKYKTRKEFCIKCGGGYKYALKHNLMYIIFPKNI